MRAAMIRCCYGSVLAENTIVNTTTFVKILGTGDTDVQRALQTIDAYDTPSDEASYPRGVEDITASTLSFDTATQTLTMTPTGADFAVFEVGTGTVVKHTFSVAQSAAIAVPAAGAWWFYFDGGVLQAAQVPPYGFRTTLVALVYLDTTLTAIAVLDERHGINMPWQTHEYLHNTIGTRFENGFGIARVTDGSGALDTDAQIIVTGGTIWDEDIEVPITRDAAPTTRFEQELGDTPATPGEIPVYYRLGSDANNWRKLAAIAAPLHNIAAGQLPAYNSEAAGVWALTQISANGRYAVYWICATNNLGNIDGAGTLCEPVFAIMGQGDYDLSTAQAASFADLQLGTFFANELKPLYKVTYRCSTGYANSYEAYIYEIDDLRNTAPLPGTAFVATDHQSLSGRTVVGVHPATAVTVDSSAFVGNLDINDDTVQKVATKVDGLSLGTTLMVEDTIFVDKSGSDATGVREDAAKPFLTVGAALAVAQAGDTIAIGAGTFTEDVVLPDIASTHIKGQGRSVTYLVAAVETAISRISNSTLTTFSLSDCSIVGGTRYGVSLQGSNFAGGYAQDGAAPITLSRCDIDGSLGLVSLYLECIGYVRTEEILLAGDVYFREIGDLRVRNLRIGSGEISNRFDALQPLPSGFAAGVYNFYSLKMDTGTTLTESGTLTVTFDASCELTGDLGVVLETGDGGTSLTVSEGTGSVTLEAADGSGGVTFTEGAGTGDITYTEDEGLLGSDDGVTYEPIALESDLHKWQPIDSTSWIFNDPDFTISEELRDRLDKGYALRWLDTTGIILYSSTEVESFSTFSTLTGLEVAILRDNGRIIFELVDDGGGDFHVDVYSYYEEDGGGGIDLFGLIGHSATITATGVVAIVEDNDSGLGGTVTVPSLAASIMLVEFYRWGVVDTLESDTLTYLGQPLTANVEYMWWADSDRVTQISAFIGGEVGTESTNLLTVNSQYLHYEMGPGRAVFQSFRAVTVNGPGAQLRFMVDRQEAFDASGLQPAIAYTEVAATGRQVSEQDASVVSGINRFVQGDLVDIESEALFLVDAFGSIENVSCSLTLVLE